MKRTDISYACEKWLQSNEVDELMKQMDPEEKRAIGRMMNSTDMPNYFDGFVDAIELFDIKTTASFDRFMNSLAERL